MPKPDPAPKRPVGRPKGVSAKVAERNKTLREMAQEYVPEAMRVVAEIAMNVEGASSARDQLSAIQILLERGYGRPAQADPTDNDTPDKPLQRIERVVIDVPVVVKKVSEDAK